MLAAFGRPSTSKISTVVCCACAQRRFIHQSFIAYASDNNDDSNGTKAGKPDERYAKFREQPSKQESAALAKVKQAYFTAPERERNRKTFQTAIGMYLASNPNRRGHIEFITEALRHLKEYNVHQDLQTYKTLMDILPKGKFIPTNAIQRGMGHYLPQVCVPILFFKHMHVQQEVGVRILDKMQLHKMLPDKELYDLTLNVFGKWTRPHQKLMQMFYWSMKFKYSHPYDVPRHVPDDAMELARLALKTMCRDPASEIVTVAGGGEQSSSGHEWLLSAQAPLQRRLLSTCPDDTILRLQGPFCVWLREKRVMYMQLIGPANESLNHSVFVDDHPVDESATAYSEWASDHRHGRRRGPSGARHTLTNRQIPTVHEQRHETIYALGASSTSSKTEAALWLQHLQTDNPRLMHMTVVIEMVHTERVQLQTVAESSADVMQ